MAGTLRFVSAGAGSGKTYRLTQILHEKLSSGQAAPGGVIATTFTRKAATELRERVRTALSQPVEVQGDEIAADQRFLRHTYGNPLFPIDLLGSLISRSAAPPWREGDSIGTVISAGHIGDVFFATLPGEGYPAIQLALEERVVAGHHFVFGVANDQLGYLISPEEGYPEVLAAAPGNDNAIFNVSSSIGDHVECSLLAAATTLGFEVKPDTARCAPWADEDPRLPGDAADG